MSTLLLLMALASSAVADTPTCEELCQELDDVEEDCEMSFGDGDDLCESIGSVEASCDPEDGGNNETCDDLCDEIDRLQAIVDKLPNSLSVEQARKDLFLTKGKCGSGTIALRLWFALERLVMDLESAQKNPAESS